MADWWILVGMMGSGKSTVGRQLAELAGRQFVDTDVLLQNRFGRSISQVFNIYGEAAFREHETSILRSVSDQEGGILSTGGGIVQRDENWEELRRLGKVIFLNVPTELLVRRLTISKRRRPLLETENWEEKLAALVAERLPMYQRADLVFDVQEEDLRQTAVQLLAKVQEAGW
ncbi:MAG: shikimate kinase [Armatimonadetes bacterium]|nr:shikimate kinase [Armatimonadota bacterium]